jgi:hypothetical protein
LIATAASQLNSPLILGKELQQFLKEEHSEQIHLSSLLILENDSNSLGSNTFLVIPHQYFVVSVSSISCIKRAIRLCKGGGLLEHNLNYDGVKQASLRSSLI